MCIQHTVEQERSLQDILAKHSFLFTEELGCLKGMEVKLNINPNATPNFFKARTVPPALKEKVERELDMLQSMGIISPVQFSRWAAHIVPVLKGRLSQKYEKLFYCVKLLYGLSR